jgi:pimeloyl-ACP methyl ester carboxylesterase
MPELVSFATKDGIELHGLLFEPSKPGNSAVIHLHGWVGNFYENSFIDPIARALTSRGISFLTFNNRGAGIVADFIENRGKNISYRRIGASLERFRDSLLDIDAAWGLLAERGYKKGMLQGHSLGCQKAAYYSWKRRPSWLKRLLFLAPVDDVACSKLLLGGKYSASLKLAERMKQKKILKRLPKAMEFYPLMNAERFLDIASPKTEAGRILDYHGKMKELRSITLPLLAIFGSQDQYQPDGEEALKILRNTLKNCDTKLIKGCGHSFSGKEKELSSIIIKWLT